MVSGIWDFSKKKQFESFSGLKWTRVALKESFEIGGEWPYRYPLIRHYWHTPVWCYSVFPNSNSPSTTKKMKIEIKSDVMKCEHPFTKVTKSYSLWILSMICSSTSWGRYFKSLILCEMDLMSLRLVPISCMESSISRISAIDRCVSRRKRTFLLKPGLDA